MWVRGKNFLKMPKNVKKKLLLDIFPKKAYIA